jgi:putative transposase
MILSFITPDNVQNNRDTINTIYDNVAVDRIRFRSILEQMTITVQLKLMPNAEQSLALRDTLIACNEAADWTSEQGFECGVFHQFELQKRFYREVRSRFGIGSEATIRLFSKVADAYKMDRKTQRKFRPLGSIAFDARNMKILMSKHQVSIWTMGGRERMPFACGDYQKEIIERGDIKQSDLVLRRDGKWFLSVAVALPDEMEIKATDVLGVDFGIAIIAADSDGNKFSGNALNKILHRNQSLRRKLQKKGTKSAKRLLKKRSGKESRFARDVNHTISKRIVQNAKCTGRAIAIEELTGIRDRIKARKSERATLHGWSFAQLGGFISYKAELNGVPLVKVDPSYTSQMCSKCGYTDKKNRKTRDEFECLFCGHASCADENGAKNIRLRGLDILGSGAFNHPNAEVISRGKSTAVSICNSRQVKVETSKSSCL